MIVFRRYALKAPFQLNQKDHALFERAGMRFADFRDHKNPDKCGFNTLEQCLPDEALIRNLEQMPREHMHVAFNLVSNLHLKNVMLNGFYLSLLNEMRAHAHKAHPFSYLSEQPATWGLHDEVLQNLDALYDKLKAHGITQMRVGQELEFGLDYDPADNITHWQDKKAAAIEQLEYEYKLATPEQARALRIKINELKRFNAQEMFMYDLIELDHRTKNILEPLFGRTRDGNGYYDGQYCFELKLAHCDLADYPARHALLQRCMVAKAVDYGMLIDAAPTSHLNISFWDARGNVLAPSHPAFLTTGKLIAEGITRATYEALPLYLSSAEMETPMTPHCDLRLDRQAYLRAEDGRIELRPKKIAQHAELMLLPLMAGVLYALDGGQACAPATLAYAAKFKKHKNKQKILHHVLSNSRIMPGGTLQVPEAYIKGHAENLAYELGLVSAKNKTGRRKFAGAILGFIKRIQVQDNQLIYPSNCAEGYKITLRARSKPWPCPASTHIIDIKKLNVRLVPNSLAVRHVVLDGYDLKDAEHFADARQQSPRMYTKLQRIKTSPILAGALSRAFTQALSKSLDRTFPPPPDLENIPQAMQDSVHALLHAARDTQIGTTKKQIQKRWQRFNMHLASFDSPAHRQAFKTIVAATLANIALKHASTQKQDTALVDGLTWVQARALSQTDLAAQLMPYVRTYYNDKSLYTAERLAVHKDIITSIFPLLDGAPHEVAHAKTIMQKNRRQDMRTIATRLAARVK